MIFNEKVCNVVTLILWQKTSDSFGCNLKTLLYYACFSVCCLGFLNESRKAFAVCIPSTVSRINRGVISNRYLDLVSHKFKSRLRFNLLAAFIGGVMKIQCTYSDGQNGKNQKNEHFWKWIESSVNIFVKADYDNIYKQENKAQWKYATENSCQDFGDSITVHRHQALFQQ